MSRHFLAILCVAAFPLLAQQPKPKAKATHDSVAAQASERAPWVGSSKGKTYYKAGCRGAEKLSPKNRVTFKSEDDAKKAGYTRSKQRGC